MQPKQAFILCGGKGERLRPLTNDIPKPMIEVNGKPILLHLVEQAKRAGAKEIILATGHMQEKIKDFFGDGKKFGVKVSYSHEDSPLGTGGALKKALDMVREKFLMLNGDNLFDIDFEKMNSLHEKNMALGTIALVQVNNVAHYGVAKLVQDKIIDFVEKPLPENAPSNWANCGAYILEKKCMNFIPNGFSLIEKNLFPKLAAEGKLFGYRHFGQWFPTDTLDKLEKARKEWKKQP